MKNENKVVQFDRLNVKLIKPNEHTPSLLQADTLFTFSTHLSYIIPSIKEKIISPRYCVEDIDY